MEIWWEMDNRNSSLVFIIFFFIRLLFQKRQACGPTLFILDISGFPDSTDVSLYADNFVYAALNNGHNGLLFQTNIDSLHGWPCANKMPVRTTECEMKAFNNRVSSSPFHKIGEHLVNHVDDINSAAKSQV